MRIIEFSDGWTTETPPTNVGSGGVLAYASESAFVTAKGSSAAVGDFFLDTTVGFLKYYEDGAWQTAGTKLVAYASEAAFVSAHGTAEAGDFFLDTGAGVVKMYAGGTWYSMVSTTGTQTLTNKTLTAPTISTPTVTTPITVAESASPSTPSSGYAAIYPKSNGKWYSKNDAGSEALLGSGSGSGAKNYLQRDDATFGQHNGDFEVGADEDTVGGIFGTNVIGWALFNTTLTGVIPTGSISAGAASITTAKLDSNALTLLEGTLSLNIGTSGATAISAGQGFYSQAFSIDACDRASVMQISFDYFPYIATGMNFSGTSSNTWAIYIYDVLNSAWIQPTGVYSMNTTGRPGKAFATFQTGSSSGIYRLAIVCINATTSAVKLMSFDNFFVGPQTRSYGAPVGDWTAYTPTGSWSSNTTYTGYWRRVGDTMEVDVLIALAGAPTSASLTVNLPSGVAIDTAKLSYYNTENHSIGRGTILDSGSTTYTCAVGVNNTTSVGIFAESAGSAYLIPGTNVTEAAPVTFANNDRITFSFKVPIQGWSSPVVLSQDTDTRVVAASVYGDPASATAGNPIIFPSVQFDTHGAYNATTGVYTVPVSGYYRVGGYLRSPADTGYIELEVDGATHIRVGRVNADEISVVYGLAKVNAGQTLNLSPSGTVDLTTSYIQIDRLSGPSVIAASEKVYLQYTGNGGTALTADTTNIDFTTKVVDSHGAWSGTVFTAPRAGFYIIQGQWLSTANVGVDTELYKGGTENIRLFADYASATNHPFHASIYLLSGEQISFRQDGTPTLSNSATSHWISIMSQG